ncbi:DNA-directed RNA polymerase II subunit rpb1 [Cerrena zonata]|uniref:DNA-directed RNA polymerase n=1 Tax=Cerrena zonata TaxID=2478898 RepID=A0AAW0G8F0_9APHY
MVDYQSDTRSPLLVRSSIPVDGGSTRSEDDLTYKLGDIIKASPNVWRCEQEGALAQVIAEFDQFQQFHVATYMDNDIAGILQALQKSGSSSESYPCSTKGQGRMSARKLDG